MLPINMFLAAAGGGLTLNDVRITVNTVMPILDAVKTVFMSSLPYIIGIVGLRLAAWLIPYLLRKIGSRKS